MGDRLVVEGYAARVHRPGDGLKYPTGDEYRDLDEVKRIVDKLPGLPVTLGHPNGMLRDDMGARVVGRVADAWLDGDHAAVRIDVASYAVNDDVHELSLGYEVALDDQRYQRDTRPDHLAIVDAARCGATCALRTDARLDCASRARTDDESPIACACGAGIAPPDHVPHLGDTSQESIKMADTEDKKLDDEIADLKGQLAALTKERDELKDKLGEKMSADEAEAVKAEKDRADKAESRLDAMSRDIPAMVRARASLEQAAAAVLGSSHSTDGKDDDTLVREIVKRLDSSIDVKTTTMPELRGHYKQLVARHAKAKELYRDAGELLAGGRLDGKAKAEQAAKLKNDWDNQHLKTLKGAAR